MTLVHSVPSNDYSESTFRLTKIGLDNSLFYAYDKRVAMQEACHSGSNKFLWRIFAC